LIISGALHPESSPFYAPLVHFITIAEKTYFDSHTTAMLIDMPFNKDCILIFKMLKM